MLDWFNKLKFKLNYYLLKRKLERNINSGKLILTNDDDRGIGKTTLLLELAYKYSIPIIANSTYAAKDLNRKLQAMKENDPKQLTFTTSITFPKVFSGQKAESLYGYDFSNGVLIDELVSEESIRRIRERGIMIRTGFHYNHWILK